MLTTLVSDAPFDTVELASAKRHLRIFTGDHDRELNDEVIPAAIQWCEVASRRTLRTAVERLTTFKSWQELLKTSLPWQPLIGVEELTYLDQNEVEQTVDPDDYLVHTAEDAAAVIEFVPLFTLPTVAVRCDAVRLDYTTGYADVTDVPAAGQARDQARPEFVLGQFGRGRAGHVGGAHAPSTRLDRLGVLPVNPRRCDKQIDVLRSHDVRDKAGQQIKYFKPLHKNVPAKYEEVAGGETVRGLQVEASVEAIFTIGFLSDITEEDRIQYGARCLEIERLLDRRGDGQWLEIQTREIKGGG
jgi:uncharacterized phiE125 gp8 family phage protein/SPP1 family predicted phage head-tail adaptor